MIALIQRVSSASVTCEGVVTASIGTGLLVLLGIEEADGPEDIAWLAPKVAQLRIFPDEHGVMNVSLKDVLSQTNSSPREALGVSPYEGNTPPPSSQSPGLLQSHLLPKEEDFRLESPSPGEGEVRGLRGQGAGSVSSPEQNPAKPPRHFGSGGEGDSGAIVVSQFTLHASTKKGNRPSYIRAARPDHAEPLYNGFADALSQELGQPVGRGVFGGDMKVALVNDGPVTIHIDTKNRV